MCLILGRQAVANKAVWSQTEVHVPPRVSTLGAHMVPEISLPAAGHASPAAVELTKINAYAELCSPLGFLVLTVTLLAHGQIRICSIPDRVGL